MKALTLIVLMFFLWQEPESPKPSVTLPEDPFVDSQTATLTFTAGPGPVAGLAVTANYRVNAHESLTVKQAIGTTNNEGQVQWTPEQAGVVVLEWEGGSKNVSVRHDGIPPMALIVAVLAGLLLLGGSVMFFVHMLRDGGTGFAEPEEQPPST